MDAKKKTIVILSGGMDSTTALAWVKSQPDKFDVLGALSFWYGSKHNNREWEAALKVAEHYQIPIQRARLQFVADFFKSDLLETGGTIPEGHYADPSMKRTVVPFRNGIMLSIAAGYCESVGAKGIVLGNHFGDHAVYPDCRSSFIGPMTDAIREGTYERVELISPFVSIDKSAVALIGKDLQVPYELTYSCYNGDTLHCGKCGTCYERKEALGPIGDPTRYIK